ncbi:hypothetical protein [Actinoplanes sp. NPDC020271]|uniref:hypothetical protein n=1 Tax=Actinoplanes sp. NPDC020271 TaxID=3363896 RepID=UPI0037B90C82
MAEYSPVPELNLLKAFQDKFGYEAYADGFGLDDFADRSGLVAGWSADPEFLARLTPFARATGGGSFYAFWHVDNRSDLATLPIVVFGDEGGQHVVARHLRELFQLLAYDTEISVDWDEAYYYRAGDEEHSDSHDEFVTWLAEHFDLAPATDPDAIVNAARSEFGDSFTVWSNAYLTP